MQRIGLTLSWAAMWGVLISPAVRAAADQPPARPVDQARVQDVRLKQDSVLQGTLRDDDGHPLVNQDVHVFRGDKFAVTTRTTKTGQFQVADVVGGEYRINVGTRSWSCRCWTNDAAPPGASNGLTITTNQPKADAVVLRGQKPLCCLWGGEPLMLGVLIAAAIAIPIAVHNSDSDDAS